MNTDEYLLYFFLSYQSEHVKSDIYLLGVYYGNIYIYINLWKAKSTGILHSQTNPKVNKMMATFKTILIKPLKLFPITTAVQVKALVTINDCISYMYFFTHSVFAKIYNLLNAFCCIVVIPLKAESMCYFRLYMYAKQ